MAPTATFKAFRPNLEGDFYATDEQNVTVNLEDRTLVSESQSYFNVDDEFKTVRLKVVQPLDKVDYWREEVFTLNKQG